MNILQLKIGKEDYGRMTEASFALFGVEVYVTRTRGAVWTVGICVEWLPFSKSKTFW